MNWLLVLFPISLLLGQIDGVSPVVIFFVSGLAIVPIAHQITESTEQISFRTGDSIGGLLNASFGNFPELIITLVALKAGSTELVAGSIIGAILANLLMAQGVSFLVGGLKYHNQKYNPESTRLYSTMMLLAVISLAVPSAFQRQFGSSGNVLLLNIIIAVLLLVMYGLYLYFTLVTHKELFNVPASQTGHDEHEAWSLRRSFLTLVLASLAAAIMSELLVGSAEQAGEILGMSQAFIGLVCVAVVGGAAESLSAISMAGRNRMDLSLGISLGSSIQIALFIAPLLVLLSYVVAPEPFLLIFGQQILVFLLVSILISASVAGDGYSNWYKGVQLILLYIMFASALYLLPALSIPPGS